MFISFEGIDASGKTTQINILAIFLRKAGIDVVISREPGGTLLAEEIRDFMLKRNFNSALSEALLINAARCLHVQEVIKPAIALGQWVLCDRFCDSTFAYQADAGFDRLQKLHNIATDNLMPDLSVILDISPKEAIARRKDDVDLQDDVFETRSLHFKQQLQNRYQEISKTESNRCYLVDATLEKEKVSQKIVDIICEKVSWLQEYRL